MNEQNNDVLIKLQDVYKIYQTGETSVHALDGVSLEIRRGEFAAIVGASGSGKSTCMNIIGCLDKPTSGSYHLAGADVLSMDDNAAGERHKRSLKLLEQVGLADKAQNVPNQLSGGQQQRVAIARALAGEPAVILADEPTGALDSQTGREILAYLKQLNIEGRTVVLITHDNAIARQAQRIIRLEDGKIVYDGTADAPEAVVAAE